MYSSVTCSTQGMSACMESVQPRSPALVPCPANFMWQPLEVCALRNWPRGSDSALVAHQPWQETAGSRILLLRTLHKFAR
ncbi:uncharacterized protein M8220_007058 isoform 5-T8 [Acridotheres tristis]